jgi:hypothetical protein
VDEADIRRDRTGLLKAIESAKIHNEKVISRAAESK